MLMALKIHLHKESAVNNDGDSRRRKKISVVCGRHRLLIIFTEKHAGDRFQSGLKGWTWIRDAKRILNIVKWFTDKAAYDERIFSESPVACEKSSRYNLWPEWMIVIALADAKNCSQRMGTCYKTRDSFAKHSLYEWTWRKRRNKIEAVKNRCDVKEKMFGIWWWRDSRNSKQIPESFFSQPRSKKFAEKM